MSKIVLALVLAVFSLAACTAGGASPTAQPLLTIPPNVTPLVTQVGVTQPENHLEAIRQAGVIRVGVSADYPPFEYLDSSGARAGFDIELMGEIAGRLGVTLEWVDLPFNDLIAAVQSKKVDAAISALQRTDERDQQVDFTAPYYTAEDAFIAADGFDGQIGSAADAATYTVGVQSGTIQEAWIRKNLVDSGKMPAASFVPYDAVESAVQDLKSGKIQLLMADYLPAKNLAAEGSGLVIPFHGVVTGGPLHIIVPEGDAELSQALNAIITQLQQEGFIGNLALRMMSEP
jgi:polar amino acid transport system substrate-binding protein